MEKENDIARVETKKSSNKDSGFALRPFVWACLRNWYWFVISVLLFGGLAFLYAKSQPQIYSSSALVLIKAEKGGQTAALDGLSMSKGYNSLSNEIYVFNSSAVVDRAVQNAGLNINYFYHKYLRDVNMYKSSPVVVKPLKEVKTSFSVNVKILSRDQFECFVGGGNVVKARFGQTINTAYGPLAITLGTGYDDL